MGCPPYPLRVAVASLGRDQIPRRGHFCGARHCAKSCQKAEIWVATPANDGAQSRSEMGPRVVQNRFQNQPFRHPERGPRAPRRARGAPLGPSWGRLGASRGLPGLKGGNPTQMGEPSPAQRGEPRAIGGTLFGLIFGPPPFLHFFRGPKAQKPE